MTFRIVVRAMLLALPLYGCATGGTPKPPVAALAPRELRLVEALARYCRGQIASESTNGTFLSNAEFERTIELDPHRPDLVIRLAQQYHEQKRTADALRILRTACINNPGDARLSLFLAVTWQAMERPDDALNEYRRLVSIAPDREEGYAGIAQTCLVKKDAAGALSAIRDGLRKAGTPDSLAGLAQRLAAGYAAAGDLPWAARWFRVVLDRYPENVSARFSLFDLLLATGNRKDALRVLKDAPPKLRDNPLFHHVAAESLVRSGYFKDAIASFEESEARQAAFNSPDKVQPNSGFYFGYGTACERSGQFERAVRMFEKSIELDPGNHEARNYVAYMWAERGDNLDKALEYVNIALQADSDNAAYVDTLGWIRFKQHDFAQALEKIRRANELMPDDPVITEHLGDVYRALKQPEQAVEQWERSFVLDPESRTVAAKLADSGVNLSRLRRKARQHRETAAAGAAEAGTPAPAE